MNLCMDGCLHVHVIIEHYMYIAWALRGHSAAAPARPLRSRSCGSSAASGPAAAERLQAAAPAAAERRQDGKNTNLLVGKNTNLSVRQRLHKGRSGKTC